MKACRRPLVILQAVGSLCLALWAPAGAAQKQTVLTVFTNGSAEYLESTREFFREFERRNPDIKIDIQTGDLNKFLVMRASGQ